MPVLENEAVRVCPGFPGISSIVSSIRSGSRRSAFIPTRCTSGRNCPSRNPSSTVRCHYPIFRQPHTHPLWKRGTRRQRTYPRRDREHGNPIRDIKTQEHGVPAHIRQLTHGAQVRRARGVLHLDADRTVRRGARAVVDVHLVARALDRTRLHAISYQLLLPFLLVRKGKGGGLTSGKYPNRARLGQSAHTRPQSRENEQTPTTATTSARYSSPRRTRNSTAQAPRPLPPPPPAPPPR